MLDILLTNFANMQILDYMLHNMLLCMYLCKSIPVGSKLVKTKALAHCKIFFKNLKFALLSYLCGLIYTIAVLFVIPCSVCVVIKRFVVLKVSFICRGVLAVSAEVVGPLLELSTGLREISQCPERGLFLVESV